MPDTLQSERKTPFPPTRWSLVVRAGSVPGAAARDALETLCRA